MNKEKRIGLHVWEKDDHENGIWLVPDGERYPRFVVPKRKGCYVRCTKCGESFTHYYDDETIELSMKRQEVPCSCRL
jgi:hypothetical protein